MTKQLEDALGLPPMGEDDEVSLPAIYEPESEIETDEEQARSDTDDVRTNLLDVIAVSQSALQDMYDIARQSQDPRAYKALNDLIKTYAEINIGIVDLQTKKQRLLKKPDQKQETKTINQNLFVGSTEELLKIIKKDDGTE